VDLAVGTPLHGDVCGGGSYGCPYSGAVWLLSLNPDGTIANQGKISQTVGGFGGSLDTGHWFGYSVTSPGDLDGNGIVDLAVGTPGGGGGRRGTVWTLFLDGYDTTPPGVQCPPIVSASVCESETSARVFFSVTASDTCTPAPSLVCSPPSGSVFPRGTTFVTCTATDAVGNQTVRTFPVVVASETNPPIIACPASVFVGDPKYTQPGEVVYFSIDVSDDCDSAPTVVCVPPSGSFFPRGTTTVTCTATDDSGNQSVCTFPVRVGLPRRR
jgi:hypothetical protein